MRRAPLLQRCRSAIAIVTLAAYATACTTWKPQPLPPAQYLAGRPPATLRVTRMDGSHIELEHAFLRGDTLEGIAEGVRPAVPVRMPLSQVKEIATHHVDSGRTVALVVGIPLGALTGLFILVVIACHGGGCD